MSTPSHHDKRRYLRYDLLDYALAYVEKDLEAIRSVIADVGLGGLALRTHDPLSAGDCIKLVIGRGSRDPITIKGVVRHCHFNDDSKLFASGIQFQPETHEERVEIAHFVHENFQRRCDMVASNPH